MFDADLYATLKNRTLPVVEITTEINASEAVLNAEDSAKLDEAVALGMPVVLKAVYYGSPSAAVYSIGSVQGMPMMFTSMPGSGYLAVINTGSAWMFVTN